MDTLLPENWIVTNLGEIAIWGSGGTPSRSVSKYYDNGTIPWVKTGDLNDAVLTEVNEYITEEAVKNSSAKIFPKGSIVIAMYGATIGKTAILGIDAATNQACAVTQPYDGVNAKYLFYYLKSQRQNFIDKGKGGAQPNISQTVIKEHPFPLAPTNEQQRITQKLDTLFQYLDILNTRLNRIPELINAFKEKVLEEAISGKLSVGWRIKNDIHKEWDVMTVGKFMQEVKDRIEPSEIPETAYIGLEHIEKNGILIGKGTSIEIKSLKTLFKAGDVLYGKLRPYLNKHVLVEFDGVCSTDILVYRNENIYSAKWFNLFLGSPETIAKAHADSKGINLPRISASVLNSYEIPVPSISEQKLIVSSVEELFAIMDKIEARYKLLKENIDKLPLSTLTKTFKGELVEHKENDEPARKLLQKIIKHKTG